MKNNTLLAVLLAATALPALAQSQHWVAPYVDRNGTFVQGHMQTNPDASRANNWSAQGNVNPYTGQAGTVNPYNQVQTPRAPGYPQPTRPPQCGLNAQSVFVCQ